MSAQPPDIGAFEISDNVWAKIAPRLPLPKRKNKKGRLVQPSSIRHRMLPTFRFYNENLQKFVLGQQPLNNKTWADYLAGLDKLGAKDLDASAKKTLQQAGFLK